MVNKFRILFPEGTNILMKMMELQNLGFIMHQNGIEGTPPGGIFITADENEMNELQATLIVKSVGDVELVEQYTELENG